MALASLFSGMALANAGLGAVHGFAAAIGGMYTAPHGVICAALLPHVMEANVRALGDQQATSEKLVRYREIAQWLTGKETADVEDGVAWVRNICHALQIAGLKNYGIKPEEVSDICEKAQAASSMKANPIALPVKILKEIVLKAL
jgi:alcohol dehydrogenase class IV